MLTVNNKLHYENREFLFFGVVLNTKAGRTERIEPSPANYQSDALPLDYVRRRKALAIRAVPSHLSGRRGTALFILTLSGGQQVR